MDDLTLDQADPQREQSRKISGEAPPELPHYRLERRLGQGTFGTVWAAVQLRTELAVAIKVLQRPVQGWDGFVREVATLRQIAEHPGVVTLLDADLQHHPPFFVMPWLKHGSLAEAPRPGLRQVLEWWRQAAQALSYTHSKGVLHCDLKPSNLLLDEENRLRLVDFGQSLMRDGAGHSLGTLGFMPPEQTIADAAADARWDVYSLAATIYWLLVGHPPRLKAGELASLGSATLEQRTALYRDLLRRRALVLPAIDGELAAILKKCLELDPQRRTSSVDQVLEDLDNWERGYPLLCRRPWSPAYRLGKWLRRPAVLVGVLAAAALCAGGWLSWLEIRQKNRDLEAANTRLQAQSVELRWEAGVQAEARNRPEEALKQWRSLLTDLPGDAGLRLWLATSERFPLVWRQNLSGDPRSLMVNDVGLMEFSRDGKQLAYGLGELAEARYADSGRLIWKADGRLGALAPGPDGGWLLTYETKVELRRQGKTSGLSGGACLAGWAGRGVEVLQNAGGFVYWDPEARRLLRGGKPGPVSGENLWLCQAGTRFQKGLWDLGRHRRVAYFGEKFHPMHMTAEGRYSVWQDWQNPRLRVHDLRTRKNQDWTLAETCRELKLSPDGSRLAGVGRNHLTCWDVRKRRVLWRLPQEATPLVVQWDPLGEFLAVGQVGAASLLDRHGQTVGGPWPTQLNTSCLQFSPDGRQLAILAANGKLELRSVSRPLQWVSDEPAQAVAWHPDDQLTRAHGLTVYHAGWKTKVREGFELPLQIDRLRWTQDGRNLRAELASPQVFTSPWASEMGNHLLDALGKQQFLDRRYLPPTSLSPDGRFGISQGGIPKDTGHGIAPPAQPVDTDVWQLVPLRVDVAAPLLGQALPEGKFYWSEDSKHFAVAGKQALSFWSVEQPGPLWESGWDGDVPWVAVAPAGRRVAAARDRMLHLYDRAGRRHDLDLKSSVGALWFSPDGRYLLVGTLERTLLVVSLADNRALPLGPETVEALAFHPRRPWLAVAGAGKVQLFDLVSRRAISGRAPGITRAHSLAFDSAGERLAIAGPAGVAIWRLPNQMVRRGTEERSGR